MIARHTAPRARHRLVVGSAAAVALLAGGLASTGQAYADAPTTTTASSTSPIVLQDSLREVVVGPTTIPEKGPAATYPMTGTVPAGTGIVTSVEVELAFEQHTFAADLDVALVGPDGTAVTLMSDVGKDFDLLGRSYLIGDRYSSRMADLGPNGSGSYRPTDSDVDGEDVFAAPGPAAADAGDHLAAFEGSEAAGSWQVFVMDDAPGDSGTLTRAAVRVFTDGRAAPYESAITVPGVSGPVTDVDVTLHGLSHSYTGDLQLALVGPGGQSVLLMSDVGDEAVEGDLVLDDEAGPMPELLPDGGTFHPTGAGRGEGPAAFPVPGPALSVLGDRLAVFDGASAAGTWSLFALDDQDQDSGVVEGGWSLRITTAGTASAGPSTLPAPVADVVAPHVVRARAAARSGSDLLVRFSEPVAEQSVSRRTVTLASRAGHTVPVVLRLNAAGDRLVIDPEQRLRRGGRYVLSVSTRVRDRSGNRLQQELVKRFSVR